MGRTLISLALLAGCQSYTVPDSEISRIAGKRLAERKPLAIEAQRDDGTPVRLRGDSFRVIEPVPGRARHRVRVENGLVPAGITLLALGAALAAGGTAVLVTSLACDPTCANHSDAAGGAAGAGLIGAGGAHLLIGLIFTIKGAVTRRHESVVRPNHEALVAPPRF